MAKRFYETVTVQARDAAFVILLDARELKTPAKKPMLLPSAALAQLVADEWQAQGDEIMPDSMPIMRMVSTALDRVADVPQETADAFAAYVMSDLLCYRAEHPEKLFEKQADSWDPLLEWAKTRFDVSLVVTAGILPVEQPEENRARFASAAGDEPLRLTALAHLAALLGSAILALALGEAHISPRQAYELAFLDDLYQIDEWGADEEAQARLDKIELEIATVARYLSAL
jgi:chaperone required for assembly of F1-ATPase